MLKLIIVEDEAIERKALRFLINKFYKEKIEIIGEASDGKQGLDMAKEYRPDLVLMDINMKGMNGLQASNLIKKELPYTEFVILTAFSYFEYAKEAINIGISDYLLKPVSNEDFIEAMDKAIEKIKVKKDSNLITENYKSQLKRLSPLIEKEIIMELIFGEGLSQKDILEYKTLLNIKSDVFTCIIFRRVEEGVFDEKILNSIKSKVKFFLPQAIGHVWFKDMIFILFDENLVELKNTNKISKLIKEVCYKLEESFQIEANGETSGIYGSLDKIYTAYHEAKILVGEKVLASQAKKHNFAKDEGSYAFDKEIVISGKIINEDFHGAVHEFDKLLGSIKEFNEFNDLITMKKRMKQFSLVMNRNIIHFFGSEFIPFNIEITEKEIEALTGIDDIKIYINNLFKEIIFLISQYKKDRNTKVIEIVKEYVRDNYMKEISLNDVADYVSFSPYYFSKLFKKIEGENFKDYLIKIRMEKAKQLLREENKSIKETAVEVGYSDPNYFSRAFKKYTGVSATEFTKF